MKQRSLKQFNWIPLYLLCPESLLLADCSGL
jgi:hypothetical protein